MEIRPECGRCHSPLNADGPAYLCIHDCTFCATCYRHLKYACPNCGGELVRRPRSRLARDGPPPVPLSPDRRITVRRASLEDLARVAPLFDAYRQFYEQPTDLARSQEFLHDRLSRKESVVLVAEEAGAPLGFVQLYPMFSSVSLGPIYVLNDLFVVPGARKRGVGRRLLAAAREIGASAGAHYLELSTAVDNPAQRLYEASEWALDREFLHYELLLDPASPSPEKGSPRSRP